MKTKTISLALAAALALGCAARLSAQDRAKLAGKCVDTDGKPLVGATVEFVNQETGQKYDIKTNKKGEYFSLGIIPGKYNASLSQNGSELFSLTGIPVEAKPDGTPYEVDFNLKKEQERANNPESSAAAKAAAAAREKAELENTKIAGLNKQLVAASSAEQAGNYDQAIGILTEATSSAPDKDLLWARLAEVQLTAGEKSSDKAAAKQHYGQAVNDYQKAIQIKPTDATYHNNLGQAYAKSGEPQRAIEEYTTAAQSDPANAAMYYFNLGATLTNISTLETDAAKKEKELDDADSAFDKATAAKPDYAEAFYQKGINLLAKATYDKATGKIMPAPGTVDAFQKYLSLQPAGAHSEEAKSIITSLGEKVETKYHKKKGEK